MVLPPQYREMYSREAICAGVAETAAEISTWAEGVERRSGEQILAVCVLRGGVFFFSDVLRSLSVSAELGFCRARSYCSGTNEQHDSGVHLELGGISLEGRTVLVVDDICDTGSTLKAIDKLFREQGAADVRAATLIHRAVENTKYRPCWRVFEYSGDEWFVGFGMEDKNRCSNLDCVCVIEK